MSYSMPSLISRQYCEKWKAVDGWGRGMVDRDDTPGRRATNVMESFNPSILQDSRETQIGLG
jgi:hypothetical protein